MEKVPYWRLCECPAVDGGVSAVEVDREKLSDWCLNFLHAPLAAEIKDDDFFCWYCIWDAQAILDAEDAALANDSLTWWPTCKTNKILQTNYNDERVKPCWIELDGSFRVEIPEEIEEDIVDNVVEETREEIACFYCQKTFTNRSDVTDHIKIMHQETSIGCDNVMCFSYFNSFEEKQKHERDVHALKNNGKFECLYCPSIISRVADFRYHIKKYHQDVAIACKFRRCGTYFSTQNELNSHMESVHPESDSCRENACFYCQKTFRKRCNLTNHIKCMHKDTWIRCDNKMCFSFFNSLEEKQKHTSDVHDKLKDKERFECVYCLKNDFLRAAQLREHVKKYHPNVAILCNFPRCVAYFLTQNELSSHKKSVHSKSRLVSCHLCGYTSSKGHLIRHMYVHHLAKTINCSKCEKTFACKFLLKRHFILSHSLKSCTYCNKKLRPGSRYYHCYKYSCRRCEVEFPCAGTYKQHLINCVSEKAIKCSFCPKKFVTHLYMKLHTDTKHHQILKNGRFKCELCSSTFCTKYFLWKHGREKHMIKMQCAHCPFQANYRKYFYTHLALEHNLLPKLKCKRCKKEFYFRSKFKEHTENRKTLCLKKAS